MEHRTPPLFRAVARSQHREILSLAVLITSIACVALGPELRGAEGRESASASPPPVNLALEATATADSEYSADYLARYAIDGRIPSAGSTGEDLSKAWCVRGDTHRQGARFTLEWPAEISVAEVLYYARTSWLAEEGWKDYELFLDDAGAPAASGRFELAHGPQRIGLAEPTSVRKLTLVFRSSYGGPNPGAAEIQVHAESAPAGSLPRLRRLCAGQALGRVVEEVEEHESPEFLRAALAGELGFDRLALIRRHPIDSTHVYTYHVEGFRAGGGLCLYHLAPEGGRIETIVDSPEGQILDCDVSADASEILFSWRRGEDAGYHVWRVGTNGEGLRQITDGRWHDYNATWLPDGGIAFLSTRSARFAYCWISPVGLLHRMDRDGANVQRLSANIVNDFTPSVLDDGRILYSRWEYVDRPAIPIQSLWTIHPDGTCLAGFYGNRVLSPATFMNARQIPGTRKVLCVLTAHNGPARGGIAIIDRSLGENAQAAIENLTPEVDPGRVDRGDGNQVKGPYETPWPLDARCFLVARAGSILLRDYAGTEQATLLRPLDGLGFANPVPVRPRPLPRILPSAPAGGAPAGDEAVVLLQDVHLGLEPEVKRGEVAEICVVQEMEKSVRVALENRAFDFQFPVISCGATYAGKKVLGYARVSPDGSACFKVPAGVPVYFIALDREGRGLQRMRTFTHFMPGETQGCVGCHEPRSSASHTTPSRARRLAAPLGEPEALRAPDWGTKIGFDYSSVVQPVLDRHCVICHDGPASPKGVDLSGDKTDFFSVSYETLARGRKGNEWTQWDSPFVSWIPTYNGHEGNILQTAPRTWGSPRSRLADLVLDGHPDPSGKPRISLSDAERRRIFAWIDLNVPYYGTSEAAYPNLQGCRRILPENLAAILDDVAKRRCASCHQEGRIPRKVWTRIQRPELNHFLAAPLARASGGLETCGRAVFPDASDPDYQAILRSFEPIARMLAEKPRDDMPGSKPDPTVCRDAQ